jgi:hypothetical protein
MSEGPQYASGYQYEGQDPSTVFVLVCIDPWWASLPTLPPTMGGNTGTTNGQIWLNSPVGQSAASSPYGALQQFAIFTSLDEDGFQEIIPSNYTTDDIVGRSEPYLTWVNNGLHTFDITVEIAAQDPLDLIDPAAGGYAQSNPMLQARWYQQLTVPLYDPSTDQGIEPAPVIVQIGGLLVARCIVQSANVTWKGPWEPGTMGPHGATVALSFAVQRIPQGIFDYSDFYSVDITPSNEPTITQDIVSGPVPLFNQFIEFPSATAQQ